MEFLSQLSTSIPAQPVPTIPGNQGWQDTDSCTARKAVILTDPGTTETAHQQLRAAGGCTYRSFSEKFSFIFLDTSFISTQELTQAAHKGCMPPTRTAGSVGHTQPVCPWPLNTCGGSDFWEAGLLSTTKHLSTGPLLMATHCCCYPRPRCP